MWKNELQGLWKPQAVVVNRRTNNFFASPVPAEDFSVRVQKLQGMLFRSAGAATSGLMALGNLGMCSVKCLLASEPPNTFSVKSLVLMHLLLLFQNVSWQSYHFTRTLCLPIQTQRSIELCLFVRRWGRALCWVSPFQQARNSTTLTPVSVWEAAEVKSQHALLLPNLFAGGGCWSCR